MPTHDAWRWVVLEILEADRGLRWEEAFGWVDPADDRELERAIDELQGEGRIRISLEKGGYVLVDEPTPHG